MWKKIFFTLIVIILLVALALALVPLNRYKPVLVRLAKEQTGMDLVIAGNVKLNILPTIHFSLGQVQLSVPDSGKAGVFSADLASASLSVVDFLRGGIEVHSVTLDAPKVAITQATINHIKPYLAADLSKTLPVIENIALQAKKIHLAHSGGSYQLDVSKADVTYGKTKLSQLDLNASCAEQLQGKANLKADFTWEDKPISAVLALDNAAIFQGDSSVTSHFNFTGKYAGQPIKIDADVRLPKAKTYQLSGLKLAFDPWKAEGKCTIGLTNTPSYDCALRQAIDNTVLAMLAPKDSVKLTGNLQHQTAFQTSGTDNVAILQQMHAQGNVTGPIEIKGMNKMIPSAVQSLVQGLPDTVPMDQCNIQYRIANQLLQFSKAECQGPVANASLTGSINIAKETLQLQMMVDLSRIGKLSKKLAQPQLYLDITGSLSVPVVAVNAQKSIVPNIINEKNIQKVLKKALPSELEGLTPLLEKGLQGLFQ